MADDDKQSDSQEAPSPAAEKYPGQPTLHEIIAQQVEELRAKLGPEATVPDVGRLPQAASSPAASPAPDVQSPAPEQESAEADADAPSSDGPAEDAQETQEAPEVRAADATSAGEPTQQDPADLQASQAVTPDEIDESHDVEETDGPADGDEAHEEQLESATPSLAEIIERQAAELRRKKASNAPQAPADEVSEDVEDSQPAEDPAEEAADISEQSAPKAEAPQAEAQDETPDAEQDAPPAKKATEAQQTLAQIIAAQREKLQAKMQDKADDDAPAKPSRADDSPSPSPEAQTPSMPSEEAPSAPSGDTGLVKHSAPSVSDAMATQTPAAAPHKRRLSLMTLFLGLNTILIGVVTFAVLRFLPSSPPDDGSLRNDSIGQTRQGTNSASAATLIPVDPLGPQMGDTARREAEVLFKAAEYRSAAGRYHELMRQAALRPADSLARDLFATRYARCMIELGQTKVARDALGEAPHSESPILRAYAHHMLAVLDHHDGAYMSARRHAYSAIGALGAMSERHSLVGNCEYVAARAMSAKVVADGSEKMGLPLKDLLCDDPMLAVHDNDTMLYRLLGNGVETLTRAGLEPSVGLFPEGVSGKRWMVAWSGPPVEQLLRKIAKIGGQDIRWGTIEEAMRRRAVTIVYRNGVSQQRLAEVACGMVGLMARFIDGEIVIANPRQSETMKLNIALLGQEAVSVWRRYILDDKVNARDDAWIAAGHYALGRVHESMDNRAEALRTYQIVFTNYDDSRVAPMALLRSAKIRQALQDYAGARKLLLQLIDLYPESGLFGEAYLNLGVATRRGALLKKKNPQTAASGDGLLDEAGKIFRRLYYLNVSLDTRKRACLELAGCLYDRTKYADAVKWATIYIGHVDSSNTTEMCQGYLMLAKCAADSGDLEGAAEAYYQVLGSGAEARHRQEALLSLTPVQLKRNHYVGAIGALNRLDREDLNPAQTLQYLILLAESYRKMSLPEKANAILDHKQDGISDQTIKDRIRVAQARCQIQMGNYIKARSLLRKALDSMITRGDDRAGIQVAHVELAEIALKLGETDLAIAGVQPVLATKDCPDDLRKRARQILVTAYVREGKYAQAADALVEPQAAGGKNNG